MMKKYIAIFGLAILGLTFSSCEKEPSFNYPDGTVGSSKVTIYPTLEIKGDKRITVAKGTAFTDPGATALEGTNPLTPVVTNVPNVNTVGLYNVTYTATNKDGFSIQAYRTVIVYDPQSPTEATDLSGTYARSSNGLLSVWTKVVPGFYQVVNPGGAASSTLTVVAFYNGSTVTIPAQEDSDGSITSSKSESLDVAGKTYTWIIINPGYGTGSRTFSKQ